MSNPRLTAQPHNVHCCPQMSACLPFSSRWTWMNGRYTSKTLLFICVPTPVVLGIRFSFTVVQAQVAQFTQHCELLGRLACGSMGAVPGVALPETTDPSFAVYNNNPEAFVGRVCVVESPLRLLQFLSDYRVRTALVVSLVREGTRAGAGQAADSDRSSPVVFNLRGALDMAAAGCVYVSSSTIRLPTAMLLELSTTNASLFVRMYRPDVFISSSVTRRMTGTR
jgi:hypothetical protein